MRARLRLLHRTSRKLIEGRSRRHGCNLVALIHHTSTISLVLLLDEIRKNDASNGPR